jgi:hypothetical protein
MHLAQVGVDDGVDAEVCGERCGGLGGAAQVRYVDRADRLVAQAFGDQPGLLAALGMQLGIALAVDQRERRVRRRRA